MLYQDDTYFFVENIIPNNLLPFNSEIHETWWPLFQVSNYHKLTISIPDLLRLW